MRVLSEHGSLVPSTKTQESLVVHLVASNNVKPSGCSFDLSTSCHCVGSLCQYIEVCLDMVWANLVNVMCEYGFAGSQVNRRRGENLQYRGLLEVVNLPQSQG